jgi:hypothetical protein
MSTLDGTNHRIIEKDLQMVATGFADGHRSEYIAGYNKGQAKCHNNNGNGNSNSAGSSSGGGSGSTSNGNILTLNFPLGM